MNLMCCRQQKRTILRVCFRYQCGGDERKYNQENAESTYRPGRGATPMNCRESGRSYKLLVGGAYQNHSQQDQ